MRYIADLHIHSPYSRATSKAGHLHGLAAWAAIKGIDVVGTGDFTHPGWFSEIQERLVEAEPGFFRLKETGPELYRDVIPEGLEPDVSRIRFVLTSEISSIYKRGGRVRKIHNILFAPDIGSVKRVNAALAAIGNLESDGRPILGLDSRDLLEILLEKAPGGFLVPAHIWTPWFSLFGSKSGFDALEECFGDLSGHIFALETGLSSDPEMNRTISALDRYSLISNSDCHSPAKLGREANILATDFDYFSMRDALRNPVDAEGRQRFAATIEFYPEEGKYHCDGHRKCGVCMTPRETREHGAICPECGRPLTVGVLYRVMELADRDKPLYPAGAPAVHSLTPLQELLGELLRTGPNSKKVAQAYAMLIQRFGSEFNILLSAEIGDLAQGGSPLLAEAVKRVRTGKVIRTPGYDGEFGVIRVFPEGEISSFAGQGVLFGMPVKAPKATRKRAAKAGPAPAAPTAGTGKKKELNPEQRQVVDSDARHIIVKAGPGTGKTHTLVRRLVRIASVPENICTVITFTNKAAHELEERFGALAGKPANVHVSTLHGYCLKWLRACAPGLGVAGPEMRRWFLRPLRDANGSGFDPRKTDEEITTFLQQAPDLRQPPPEHLLAYFDLLKKENCIDIDAVVPQFTALLREEDAVAATIRQGTGFLFIDEFQDLNQSQYEAVRLLAASSPVFAIGDPDQAVYGFRGASPAWFYRFMDDLAPKRFSLFRNYRCGAGIVKAADHVIRNNPHPGPYTENKSFASAKGEIYCSQALSPRHEASLIVGEIEKLLGGTSHREIDRLHASPGDRQLTMSDIAILYRTSRQADILASTLYEHGFPVQVVDVRPYYLGDPVRPLYLWTLLASGHGDAGHLLALLQNEPGADTNLVRDVEQWLPKGGADPLQLLLERIEDLPGPAAATAEELLILREKILFKSEKEGVTASLQQLAEHCGLDGEVNDVRRFYRMAENFSSDLGTFARHLILHSDSVVYDERAEAVSLMTLHASKGLEFKVVFMAGLEEGVLPVGAGRDESGDGGELHIEEERRLFYVGMTRAEETLYLSHVRTRRKGGRDVVQAPSRFISEIPPGFISSLERKVRRRKPVPQKKQLSLF